MLDFLEPVIVINKFGVPFNKRVQRFRWNVFVASGLIPVLQYLAVTTLILRSDNRVLATHPTE